MRRLTTRRRTDAQGSATTEPESQYLRPATPSHDLTCSTASDTAYMNGFGGTSGATPKVAATAALMLAVDPTFTHKEIRTILRDTGSAVITDSKKPVGTLLNSKAAVRTARLD